MDIIFTSECFKDMILFSGRFANKAIPESDWKEVYGFLAGKIEKRDNNEILYAKKLIPMVHGTRTEVYFTEEDYAISELVQNELDANGLFIIGWFHTHPGLGLFLSEVDIINQLGFQSVFPDAIAAVFDFTKVGEKSSGLKVYRLKNPDDGVASDYVEVSFIIEHKEKEHTFVAKSLIDIASSYAVGNPFVLEAGERLKTGELKGLFSDELLDESLSGSDISNIEGEEIPISRSPEEIFKDFKGQFNSEAQYNQPEQYNSEAQYNQPEQYNSEAQYNQPEQFNSEAQYDRAKNMSNEGSGEHDYVPYDDSGYYDLLESYSDDDWEIISLREQIERKKELNEPAGYLLIFLANRLFELGKYREGLENLESAEDEFNALSSAENDSNAELGLAVVYNELGLYYEDRGDYINSLNYFETSLEILSERNNNAKIIQVLNNIGNVYLKMENYNKAFDKFKEAFNISKKIGYELGMISTLNNTVDVLLFLKNYRKAYEILVANLSYFQAKNEPYGFGITLTKFGHLYYTQGPDYYHLSKQYFEMALTIKKQSGNINITLDDHLFLAEIYIEEQNFSLAETHLLEALEITRRYNYTKEEGKIYKKIAELYSMLNKYNQAIDYYNLAKESFEDFDEQEELAMIYEKLSQIYFKISGDTANQPMQSDAYKDQIYNALNNLYEALKIYREQQYSKKIAEVLERIAEFQLILGDTQSAVDSLSEAKRLYQSLYDSDDADRVNAKLESLQ